MTRRLTGRLARHILLLAAVLLALFVMPVSTYGQQVGAALKGDLSYLGYTVWEDAKTIARAPLEIDKVREVTPEQVLIGALVAGSIGGMIALDNQIREAATGIGDASALTLQNIGLGMVAGGLATLYGAALWTDNEQWRHAALTGTESTLVSLGLANPAKVAFGRERPDADKGPEAWFQGGRSFVSGDTTPAFAMAEAVAAAFDHRWWVTLPAYGAAAAVGVGRMGRDRHWASDILASAFLGIGTTKLFNYIHRQREQAAAPVTFSPLMAPAEFGLRVEVHW
jgi:membrane-associated phospholipid phosphatase